MRRNAVLLLSLLLVVGSATVPLGAVADRSVEEANPLIVSQNATANYLAIPASDVAATGTTTDGLALGTAIAVDTYGIQGDHDRLTFERSFEQANSESEKTAAIRTVANRVDRQKRTLVRRDAAAIGAYANGTISAATFVHERARIHAEASQLQVTVEHVEQVVRADDRYSLSPALVARLVNLAADLETLQGPVSGHVVRATSGEARGQSIYVESSTDGFTLAYVTDDSYVRETYLGDEREPASTDLFDASDVPRRNAAHNRGLELYPWATNHSVSPNTFGLGTGGIYRFSVDFTNGELTAYLDGNTTNVFREEQRQKLGGMLVSRSFSAANGSLQVRVNRTYETGPMQVALARNTTGRPVDGTVSVDGSPVGTTGADGRLWFVEPRGTIRVTGTSADGTNVTVTVPAE